MSWPDGSGTQILVAPLRKSRRQAVEGQEDHGSGIQRQHLAEQQAADDSDTQRPAQLGTDAGAQRQRQTAEQAAIVVIMIGRKRSRQAW